MLKWAVALTARCPGQAGQTFNKNSTKAVVPMVRALLFRCNPKGLDSLLR